MQRIKMIVDEKGNVEVDLLEGFSGTTCEAKAKNIEVLIAGAGESKTKYKPEYYEMNKDEVIDIFTGK